MNRPAPDDPAVPAKALAASRAPVPPTPASPAPVASSPTTQALIDRPLLPVLLMLSGPVLVEHTLHMFVGLTDTYIASHLPNITAPATAAVGTIAYFLWFLGIIVGAVAAGSTALIARARGARHRSLANSVTGQSMAAGAILGLVMAGGLYLFAEPIVAVTQLHGQARDLALAYLRLLAWAVPLNTLMLIANACLRGHGDTLTPAFAMVVVDGLNIALSLGLGFGLWGLPNLGFEGIAIGTVAAYGVGGLIQVCVLLAGRKGLRLYLHRLRPHWHTLRRILRVGIPAGVEGALAFAAQFCVLVIINHSDPSNVQPAAHINAIRIEGISFMAGFAVAVACATMVGQALGARRPDRARRAAYLAFAVGGGFMTLAGVGFILFARTLAGWLSPDPHIVDLTAACLRIAGAVQAPFAASAIFGFALRGAGDTLAVMVLNLISQYGVRLVGVAIVGWWLGLGIVAVWAVLCLELCTRGLLMWLRFAQGRWATIRV